MSDSADAEANLLQGRLRVQGRSTGNSANTSSKLGSSVPSRTGGSSGFVSGSGARPGARTNVAMAGSSSSSSSSSSSLSKVAVSHFYGHGRDIARLDNLANSSVRQEEITDAYERLRGLGMPLEITFEVFENLVTGQSSSSNNQVGQGAGGDKADRNKIGAAIILLSKRLAGRQDAHRLRGVIAKAREENAHAGSDAKMRPVSRIKAPSATATGGIGNKGVSSALSLVLDDPMKSASTKRDNAYRVLVGGVRKEYEDVRQEMLALDAEKRKLEEDVQVKRRVALLMNVLERREMARVARLSGDRGMGVLLSDLRKTADSVMKEYNRVVADLSLGSLKNALHNDQEIFQREAMVMKRNAAWKYRHTTEMLANLHAIHIRRASSADLKEHDTSVGKDIDGRLQKLLDRLGVHVDHDAKESMKQKLIEVARRRMERRNKLPWMIQEEHVDDVDLDDMHRSVEENQRRVQEKVNRAAAIGWLCQEYIDLIITFRAETATALSGMLDEEGRRVDGYIDVIKDALVQSEDNMAKINARRNRNKSFAKHVSDIVGTGRETPAHILEDVRSMIERVAVSEHLVNRELPKLASLEGRAGVNWVGSGSVEKNRKVLERKGNKTDYGFELAEEIKTLLADCRRLK